MFSSNVARWRSETRVEAAAVCGVRRRCGAGVHAADVDAECRAGGGRLQADAPKTDHAGGAVGESDRGLVAGMLSAGTAITRSLVGLPAEHMPVGAHLLAQVVVK